MSSYHIAKDGKPTGPMDEETIRQKIATGTLNQSDLCWREGMADWQAIGTLPKLLARLYDYHMDCRTKRCRPLALPRPDRIAADYRAPTSTGLNRPYVRPVPSQTFLWVAIS